MKNLLLIVLTFLLLQGCVTQRACDRRFPSRDSTLQVTITKTIYRDTAVYIPVEGDTVERVITIYLKNGLSNSATSVLNTQLAVSRAWVENGLLRHTLIQKDTALKALIKNAIKDSTISTIKERTVFKTNTVNFITGWQWFQIWTGRIAIALILLLILIGILMKLPILQFIRQKIP